MLTNLTSLYDDIIRSTASAPDDNKFLLIVNSSDRELMPNGSPIGSDRKKKMNIQILVYTYFNYHL